MTEQRYAILIGNSEFPKETGLSPLRCPPDDVQGLAKVLEASNRGQFEVTMLINKPKQDVENELLRTINKAGKEDLVLIYFSGHGKPSNLKGQLYLAVHNTELALLQATAIAVRQIKAFIDDARCNRIILILDCCYSGAIDGDFFKGEFSSQANLALKGLAQNEGRGLHIMTASTSVQTAVEKERDLYSVFTKHLINGIDTGAADKHSTGFILLNELFAYIKEQVKGESSQTPQIFNFGGGDLLIAHSGKSSRKERFNAVRAFLLDLLNRGYIHDEVYAEAIKILGLPEARLAGSGKLCDELLTKLYAKEMEPAVFVGKWALARVAKPADVKPGPIIIQPTPIVKKITYPKKRLFIITGVLLVAAVVMAGWYHGIDNLTPPSKPTTEQQLEQAKDWLNKDDNTKWPSAIRLLEPLVKDGNAKAISLLANSYYFGLGVKENKTKACQLFKQAIDANNTDDKNFYDENCG